MGGYLGTTPVVLSTTLADVNGPADISGDLTVDGNVGIGVVPSAWGSVNTAIQVRSSGFVQQDIVTNVGIGRNAVQDGPWSYVEDGYAQMLNLESDGAFKFFQAGSGTAGNNITFSEAMRIDSSGNLLVGTTSAVVGGGPLQVKSKTGSENVATFQNGVSDSGFGINFLSVAGSGVGSIAWTGSATNYNTSSDYRLKTDVQAMTGASARVQALKPVNFEWLADGSRTDGFLAHELQAVVPEAATGTKDAVDEDGNPEYQGIDQSKLVPLLTAALQEALARIEALEAKA